MRIYSAVAGIDVHQSPALFAGDNMSGFKDKLADLLVDKICPIGESALRMCESEEDRLLEVLDSGARKADEMAKATLVQMKKQVGMIR